MNPLDQLEKHYAPIVALMKRQFDSHTFILKLAENHQAEYVRALNAYIDSSAPFKVVHGQIAKRLRQHDELVRYLGETESPDIFGNRNSAALWERVDQG